MTGLGGGGGGGGSSKVGAGGATGAASPENEITPFLGAIASAGVVIEVRGKERRICRREEEVHVSFLLWNNSVEITLLKLGYYGSVAIVSF